MSLIHCLCILQKKKFGVIGNMTQWKTPGFKMSPDLSTVSSLYSALSEQIHPALQHIHSLSILSVMFVKALINPRIDSPLITAHIHISHANRPTNQPSGLEGHDAAVLRLTHSGSLWSLTDWDHTRKGLNITTVCVLGTVCHSPVSM